MLPLESCFMTSGFRFSFGPVDTGLDAAGNLASSRIGECLLTTIREAVRPKLMGTMLRRNAERAMRSVAILKMEGIGLPEGAETKIPTKDEMV